MEPADTGPVRAYGAALSGQLAAVKCEPDLIFNVPVPAECPDVPSEVLKPRGQWPDPAAYDAKARELAERFTRSFAQFDAAPAEVRAAGLRT